MKEKLLIFIAALFIFTPLNNVLAAEDIEKSLIHDYVDLVEISTNKNLNEDILKRAYDRNLNSYIHFNENAVYLKFTFKKPVNIKKVFFKYSGREESKTRIITTESEVIELERLWANGDNEVNYENVISIEIYQQYGYYSFNLYEIDLFGSFVDISPEPEKPKIENISNIEYVATSNSILFNYELPTSEKLSHIKIIANGKEYQTTENSFYIEGLEPNTEYEITFISVDTEGNESPGVTIFTKTKEKIIEEVKEVKVQAKHNRVDLSWQLPKQDDFHHVKIYRKTIEELKEIETASIFNLFKAKKVFASETEQGFEPFFETNGTYFNDLTVLPRSEYAYKLTTVTTDEKESPGVIVTAETPDEPEPEIVGGNYTETENGDFLYTWTQPTSGEVKIIVGGEEYATVPASQKEILIPAEDMKYIFGKPDVSLIPISEYGKIGNEFNPTNPLKNIDIGFNPNDLLKSGVSLLAVIGPIVLLSLSFVFLPRMIKVIKKANAKR